MTEDGSTINVSVDAVYAKYREQTDAELSRLRHALASAETAVDTLVAERAELRAEVSRLLAELGQRSSLPMPGPPRVPDALGARRPRDGDAPA